MKTYRHSEVLTGIMNFLVVFARFRQLTNVHPTTDGSVVLMHDDITDVTYRIHMDVIRSEVKVSEHENRLDKYL